jgi:hypothetical protein
VRTSLTHGDAVADARLAPIRRKPPTPLLHSTASSKRPSLGAVDRDASNRSRSASPRAATSAAWNRWPRRSAVRPLGPTLAAGPNARLGATRDGRRRTAASCPSPSGDARVLVVPSGLRTPFDVLALRTGDLRGLRDQQLGEHEHHGLFEHRFHPLTRRTAFSNRMITAPPGATCSRTQVCARRAVGLDVSPTLVCDWNCVGGALVGQAIADLVVRLDDAHIVLALASTFLPADAGGERCRRSSRAPDEGATWVAIGTAIDAAVTVQTIDGGLRSTPFAAALQVVRGDRGEVFELAVALPEPGRRRSKLVLSALALVDVGVDARPLDRAAVVERAPRARGNIDTRRRGGAGDARTRTGRGPRRRAATAHGPPHGRRGARRRASRGPRIPGRSVPCRRPSAAAFRASRRSGRASTTCAMTRTSDW